MTEDEIIEAYKTLCELAQGDPYFLSALNRLRKAAMEINCPNCADIACGIGGCAMCAELRTQVGRLKKDRLGKIKKLATLRKRLNIVEEKILNFESRTNLDNTPKNVEIKIVETWDENAFAKALNLGHFSDRGF